MRHRAFYASSAKVLFKMKDQKLDFDLGKTVCEQASYGLIVLQADETIEYEVSKVLSQRGCGVYTSRVKSGDDVTVATLSDMEKDLQGSAALFPKSCQFDVVGYGCTSGTSVIGANRISELIKAGCHTRHVTEPVSALLAACETFEIKRLAFLSPYIAEVSQRLRDVLTQAGIEIHVFGSFQEQAERNVARITPKSVMSAAHQLVKAQEVDALFLSCTNLQSFSIIEDLEQSLNMVVLSSNLVLTWHMMQLSGVLPAKRKPGRLMREL